MNTVRTSTAFSVAAILASVLAHADFQAALEDYNAARYDAAHAQFLSLAELGDCASQFNLAAMALKGQGVPQDSASGVGWLQAAAANGCQQLVGDKATHLAARLDAQQSQAAAQIVARYGPDALRTQGVIDPQFTCRDIEPPTVSVQPDPEYPHLYSAQPQQAIVITALTIGADGKARDPEVLLAVPQDFAASAIEKWLNSSFIPAQQQGQSVAARLVAKQLYTLHGGKPLSELEPYRLARPRADGGDPQARYLVGLTATFDSSLGISSARGGALLLEAARAGGAQAQYWIGAQLRASRACHPQADGAVWLRHAAASGNPAAQILLATDLLSAAADPAQIAAAKSWLATASTADSYYVRKHAAALLAASPVEAIRDAAAARNLAAELASGPIQSDPQMFEVLAAVAAANGDFKGAIAQQLVALQKAHTLGWARTAGMEQRLAAYRAGQPWRGDLFAS
jgi:hypothetical protein